MYGQNDHRFPSRAALIGSSLYGAGRGIYNYMTQPRFPNNFGTYAKAYGAYTMGKHLYRDVADYLYPQSQQRSHWGRGGRRLKVKRKLLKKYKKKKYYRRY